MSTTSGCPVTKPNVFGFPRFPRNPLLDRAYQRKHPESAAAGNFSRGKNSSEKIQGGDVPSGWGVCLPIRFARPTHPPGSPKPSATEKRRRRDAIPRARPSVGAYHARRTQVLTRSPGRAACWTRAHRSALPGRSHVRRCARRFRRCHRRGPRTRRENGPGVAQVVEAKIGPPAASRAV